MRVSDFYPFDWTEQMKRLEASKTKLSNWHYNASMHKQTENARHGASHKK